MILNVSGRTDIVAFYSEWFKKRYEAGFVDVRNPIYPKLVSRIYFKDVDLIVFCTKNPHPIISYLKNIKQPILFHVTLTPYNSLIEPNVPSKKQVIEDIKIISNIVGINNDYLRYDPIFLNSTYTLEYHIKAFNKLCTLLEGYVKQIIVSFINNYKNVWKNMDVLQIKNFTSDDFRIIGENFSRIAKEHGMSVQTCSEYQNLEEYGFLKEDCVSREKVFSLTGKKFPTWKGRNNPYCHCTEMVDIGSYNTCSHLCKYCYANFQEEDIIKNRKSHEVNSSLLIGHIEPTDEVKVRK